MKTYELTIQQKRVEALYEREIRRIVYHLSRRDKLPSLPISHCRADRKFQMLRIYISLTEKEEGEQGLLAFFNKKYTPVIARLLASTQKFRRIPQLLFLVDKELAEINRIEELVKSN